MGLHYVIIDDCLGVEVDLGKSVYGKFQFASSEEVGLAIYLSRNNNIKIINENEVDIECYEYETMDILEYIKKLKNE